jgi:hypothetical protein
VNGFFTKTPPLPRSELLESGDLVWPKKPGSFIPYSQRVGLDRSKDRAIWENEKEEFLAHSSQPDCHLTTRQISIIRNLDYRSFLVMYQGNRPLATPALYSSADAHVGHVGIIDVAPAGEIYVIEALDQGVVRDTYQNWLSGRPGEIVWLGRLDRTGKAERAKISMEAAKYVGRPYNFWNFDLDDANEFYCSKLVWLAIFRSLGVAVDGDPNPKRAFWLSPKQLLDLAIIRRLHDPGNYATR